MRRHDLTISDTSESFWQLWQFWKFLTISDDYDDFWQFWQFLKTLAISENFCNFWHLWKASLTGSKRNYDGVQFMRNPVVAKKVLVVQCGDRAPLWRFCGCAALSWLSVAGNTQAYRETSSSISAFWRQEKPNFHWLCLTTPTNALSIGSKNTHPSQQFKRSFEYMS